MFIRGAKRRRAGKTLAEGAIVYPAAMMLMMGTIISGMGVFRYQQLAFLAREGARWASVHGPAYQSSQSQSAPTSATVLSSAIYPRMTAMDKTKLTCAVSMTNGQATVTLTYAWVPEGFFQPVTMTSTSSVPITY